ncbi:AraC family transcriptional regulator [Yersinia enterocolitica]|uniref:AraC family transcriptional regulator n=1 Tax=Yersinia enterocolitica TaxID=630 RepID=UPI0002DB381B|nr:AraC family transcriptional regulator [Yersinia enterocolitica]
MNHSATGSVKQEPGLVATLAYDGLCLFEFSIAQEIFGLARPEFDFPWYQNQVVGVDKHISTANGSLHIHSGYGKTDGASAWAVRRKLDHQPDGCRIGAQ